MVNRWRCRRCDFATWSSSGEATASSAKSHLVKHYRDNFRRQDFGIAWDCPYCDEAGRGHDADQTIERFKDHLFSHVEPLMESGVHVADDIDRTGSILVHAGMESAGADNARVHFTALGDICLFVTTNPERRVELLNERLSEWPAWTIVITTKSKPFANTTGLDISTIPLEVVQLDKRLGLGGLGETISRVLDEHESTEGKLTVGFDVLPEILAKFDLQQVFKFLHVLTGRCDRADALSHYYFDPETQSASTVNIVDRVFDLQITAANNTFTSRP